MNPHVHTDVDFQPDLVVLTSRAQNEPPSFQSQNSLPVLHPGSDILINIHIHNLMHKQKAPCRLRVQTSRAFASYSYNDSIDENGILELPVNIGSNQLFTMPFRFRVGDTPGETILPRFEVYNSRNEIIHSDMERRVEVSEVHWVSNLIGQASNKVENVAKACRVQGKVKCFVVDGHSGVGKTRFLTEVAGKLWSQGYDLLRLDMEEVSGGDLNDTLLLRHILAQLHALPLLEPRKETPSDVRKKTLADDDTEWVEGILYKGVLLESSEDIERCALVLAKGLSDRRTAFLIDNAQNVSEREQQVFERMGNLIHGKGESVLVFSFNVNKIYGRSPGGKLYEYCLERCLEAVNHWSRHTLKDFSSSDVRTFLNSALVPRDSRHTQFSEAFPLTTKSIEQSSAHRPLYLWHLLLALQTEGILKREGGCFVPRQAGEFADSVSRLPGKVNDLLNQRWEKTLAVCDINANLEKLRTLVGLFFAVPAWLVSDLRIPVEDVKLLELTGFIQRTSSGDLMPSHQEVYRLFERKEPSLEEARNIAQAISKRHMQQRFLYQYFICCDALNTVDASLVQTSLQHLSRRRVEPAAARGDHFLIRMIDILDSGAIHDVDGASRLYLMHKAIDNLAQITSNKRLTNPLQICLEHVRFNRDAYLEFGEEFFQLAYLLSNLCFARNTYSQPYTVLKAVVADVSEFSFKSGIDKALCLGALVNRLGVAAMWQTKLSEAIQYGQRGQCIGQDLIARLDLSDGSRERAIALCIEAAVDLGNIHDILPESRNDYKMLTYWQQAVDIYYNNMPKEAGKYQRLAPMVAFYEARIDMAHARWGEAREKLDNAIWQARQDRNSYHGIRCILLQGIIDLLQSREQNQALPISQLNQKLDRALDWAIASGTSHAEWGALLIRAELAVLSGDSAIAAAIALDSLKGFQDTAPDAAMLHVRTPYIAAATAIIRLAEIIAPESILCELDDGYQEIINEMAVLAPDAPWREFNACDSAEAVLTMLKEIAANTTYRYNVYPFLSQ